MYKQLVVVVLLIMCALPMRAEDSIKVSTADLKALIQRVERLERQTVNPNNKGYVDAVSGATVSSEVIKAAVRDALRKGL